MDNVLIIASRNARAGLAPTRPLGWEALDRQDWHLWMLTISLMFVLGVSLLSFMFPTAFWFGEQLAVREPQRAFLGFCVLLALVLLYLMQRQATMRRLKHHLFEARTAATDADRRANLQALLNLPGMVQFRDGLAMEYRRASSSGSRLAVVLLSLRSVSREEMGQVASSIRLMLRRGETLARISDTTLGVILPEMQLSDANAFAVRAEEYINSDLPEIVVVSTVTAYPQEAASLADLESPLRGGSV